jgi:DNA-binding transcriptional regulator YiaG
MFTFAETPTFAADADKLWTEEERLEFFVWLASHPDAGDVIPGSGGCRKVRWSRPGMGKRGGVRVIYFLRKSEQEIWLLLIYAKSVKDTTFLVTCSRKFERKSKMVSRKSEKTLSAGEALGRKLLQSVREMKAARAARVTKVELNEVVQARQKTGLSQAQFAEALHISKRTLQDWEQGRRSPSGAAQALIRIATKHPKVVREALV